MFRLHLCKEVAQGVDSLLVCNCIMFSFNKTAFPNILTLTLSKFVWLNETFPFFVSHCPRLILYIRVYFITNRVPATLLLGNSRNVNILLSVSLAQKLITGLSLVLVLFFYYAQIPSYRHHLHQDLSSGKIFVVVAFFYNLLDERKLALAPFIYCSFIPGYYLHHDLNPGHFFRGPTLSYFNFIAEKATLVLATFFYHAYFRSYRNHLH